MSNIVKWRWRSVRGRRRESTMFWYGGEPSPRACRNLFTKGDQFCIEVMHDTGQRSFIRRLGVN